MWLWCRCFLQMLYIVVRNCVFLAKWKWNWTFLQNLVCPLTGSTMTIGMNADPFSTSSSLPWMAPELSKRITFACLAQAPHCQAIWQFVDVLMNGARGWCYATTAQGWRRGGVNVPCAWRAQDDVIEVQVPFAAPMIRVQSGMQRWRKRWVLCWVQLILVRSSDLCIYNIHTSKQKTLLQKKQKNTRWSADFSWLCVPGSTRRTQWKYTNLSRPRAKHIATSSSQTWRPWGPGRIQKPQAAQLIFEGFEKFDIWNQTKSWRILRLAPLKLLESKTLSWLMI